VANADAGTVSRLDAAGRAVDLQRKVGSAPLRLTATAGSVWVTVFRDGTVTQIDARTGKVEGSVRVGPTPEGLTAAFGSLWVVLEDPGELVRIDPGARSVVHRYSVGAGPRLVAAGHGQLWVSSFTRGRLIVLDPVTGRTRTSGVICQGPQGMLVGADTIWVACTTGNELVGVDRSTLKPTARLDLPGAPDAVRAGPRGQVVVGLQQGPTIVVVDPSGPSVTRQIRVGHADQLYDRANIDLLVHDGGVWISSYLEGGVYRAKL
jgi:DNA-binding beta-propeller fold protein YncE